MRRLSVLVPVLALVMGTAGCPALPRPGALRPAAPRVLSEAQLAAALLTVPDLPNGYALDAEAGAGGTDRSAEPSTDELIEPGSDDEACDQVFDEVRGGGPALGATGAVTAEIEFTRGELGPFVSQSLHSSRDRAAIHAAFEEMRRVPQLCREFTESDDDGSFTIRMTEASFPQVGEDSFAIRLDASGGGEGISITLGGYLVLIRVAATVSMIVHVGAPGVDAGETERVARAAAARLTPVARPR
jgi:hypothetical protein